MAVSGFALSGVARSGATRSGYVSPSVFVSIGGTEIACSPDAVGQVILEGSIEIEDTQNEVPTTCTLQVHGFAPTVGQEVIVRLGSKANTTRLFAGHVLKPTLRVEPGLYDHLFYTVECVDATWLLQKHPVSKRYTNLSASAIAVDLVSFGPAGLTTNHVQTGMDTIDEITFTDEDLPDALTRLMKRVEGVWYRDYDGDLHAFVGVESGIQQPLAITTSHPCLTSLQYDVDLTGLITRCVFNGGGANALVAVAAGETILPVNDTAWYNALGGTVTSGPQAIDYTGLNAGGAGSLVGPGVTPSAAPVVTASSGSGVDVGSHGYSYTWVTAAGETLPSPLGTYTAGSLAAPVSAPGIALRVGAGLGVGAYEFAVTFQNAAGETTPSPIATITTTQIAAPASAPTVYYDPLASLGTTSGDPYDAVGDTLEYALSYGDGAAGETDPSAATSGTTTSYYAQPTWSQTVRVEVPAVADTRITVVYVYRRKNGGVWYRLATVTPSRTTTTRVTDTGTVTTGVAPLGASTFNFQNVLVTIPVGSGGVTGRRIYRTVAGGSQLKLLHTVADNTTTSYLDSNADGTLGADAPTSNTATMQQSALSGISIGPTGTTSRKVYRTVAGGSTLKLLHTIADNTTTTYSDSTADASLGATAPGSDTSALTQPNGTVVAGATSIRCASLAAFESSGGWAIIGNGQQTIRYTGLSSTALTGIPTSGAGAIVAAISYNSTITAAPALLGIAASGDGSIVYNIKSGDPVNIQITVNDTAARAGLAAYLGSGDGVRTATLQDGRMGETEATAQATAYLAANKTVKTSADLVTRDQHTASGSSIGISFGTISDTLKIQKVVINNFSSIKMPDFHATAGQLLLFDDFLRDFRLQSKAAQ